MRRFATISLLIAIIVLLATLLAVAFYPEKEDTITEQYNKNRLLGHLTEEEMEEYDSEYKKVWSSTYPPLKPERFRRKMKMLFAIDINDYPKNSLIQIIGGYPFEEDYTGDYISLRNQRFYNLIVPPDPNLPEDAPSPFDGIDDKDGEDYGEILLNYFFHNDRVALDSIITYKYRICKKALGESWREHELLEDLLFGHNILYFRVYSCLHTTRPELIEYADKNRDDYDDSRYLRVDYGPSIHGRASDIRGDTHLLYIREERKKGRKMKLNSYNTLDDISVSTNGLAVDFFNNQKDFLPWREDTPARSTATYMTFLVKLQEREINKFVIKYMSGQYDGSDRYAKGIRAQIRANNYYGHAVLREFCEDPERAMPTMEKVGTSFYASVANPSTLLYLEPYADSYDIDIMQPTEGFKAYEMSHDDYYFVEVVKPVESPVAGPDGYAMILDRTETVYGYIKKADIKEIAEVEYLKKTINTPADKQKRGVITDPDGYVNIRTTMSSEGEIAGRIEDREISDSNWWFVQTANNVTGFVHKSRIREKPDAGGWESEY